MNEEIWRDIKGYEGLYQISSIGRVKRLEKIRRNGRGYRKYKEQITDGYIDDVGYRYVILTKERKEKRFRLHRLVAEAFIPNPDNKPEIDHINTNRTDNRIENLRWVTRKENLNNKITKIKMSHLPKPKGKNHPRARKVQQFNIDGTFVKEYDCIKDAVVETNGSKAGIILCCQGKRKTSGGCLWKYKKEKAA